MSTREFWIVCALALLLLCVGYVIGEVHQISDQLDHIDAQMAPEPTPTGRVS